MSGGSASLDVSRPVTFAGALLAWLLDLEGLPCLTRGGLPTASSGGVLPMVEGP